jgi:shikimate dehydrogenase
MRIFGLIGFPLSHSFSKKYFTEKFEREQIPECRYELFELKSITELLGLIDSQPDLQGLNVTIPYKQEVKQYIHQYDKSAEKVGAVNVIKVHVDKTLTGYNSDYYGFKLSLEDWLPHLNFRALVLGTGGASKAVIPALDDLGIANILVSRSGGNGLISYNELNENPKYYQTHRLIINTTPLGMSPNVDSCPELNYQLMNHDNYLYDLVYNPLETKFMLQGKANGAQVKNGLEMLHLQAEKSWEIWNS